MVGRASGTARNGSEIIGLTPADPVLGLAQQPVPYLCHHQHAGNGENEDKEHLHPEMVRLFAPRQGILYADG